MYWLHRLFWLLDAFLPEGTPGVARPLWPGLAAFLILIAAVVFSFFVWQSAAAAQPDRLRIASLGALAALVFGLLDWALLAILPRLGLSFGGLARGLIGMTFVRLVGLAVVILALFLAKAFQTTSEPNSLVHAGLISLVLLNMALLTCEFDGLYVEPFDLQTTRLSLPGPSSPDGAPLRVLQISDLHVERITRREQALIQTMQELHPDLILLTGDYANLDYLEDPQTWRDTREVLSNLNAPLGVYAILGSVDPPQLVEAVFKGLSIRLLEDEIYSLKVGTQTIDLIGVTNENGARDAQALAELAGKRRPTDYSILLYHTPDLVEVADQAGIDLYLAGHTHGGQIRLPLYGAVITMSTFGKKYERGLYQLNPTTLYVSRGIGMEGMGLPRMRFLCPPELVLIELGGKVDA